MLSKRYVICNSSPTWEEGGKTSSSSSRVFPIVWGRRNSFRDFSLPVSAVHFVLHLLSPTPYVCLPCVFPPGPGAKTIKKSGAWIGAQLMIFAQ